MDVNCFRIGSITNLKRNCTLGIPSPLTFNRFQFAISPTVKLHLTCDTLHQKIVGIGLLLGFPAAGPPPVDYLSESCGQSFVGGWNKNGEC